MEFLPPEGAHAANKGKAKETYTRARLAWYYRPSDVSDRPVQDPRLLLAAIYSEVCDISQLRSRCFVVHRDKITDLAGWKKRPDRFYFNRLFDPYINKEFEVIQAKDIRNVPDIVRDTLNSRYEFVVAEKEAVPDLTDLPRLCGTCNTWCPTPETVQCDRCKKYFHMGCVQPPLLAKPSRGYGWTCAPCSKRHAEEVDSHDVRHPAPAQTKPKTNAPAPRGRGRPRKDRSLAEKEEASEVKHFKMWPFRYFGQYTVAEDTLDPDDLIFPRTATRVGPKYQAVIPGSTEGISIPVPTEERGGDETIEVLSAVHSMSKEEADEVDERMKTLTRKQELLHSVDWLTEAVRRFSQAWLAGRGGFTVDMSSNTRQEKWKRGETRYTDRPWSPDEVAAFEDGIMAHGAELRAVCEEVATRPMPEVVRFYGQWKNSKLKEENARRKARSLLTKDADKEPAVNPVGRRPGIVADDDEGSIVHGNGRTSYSCGACRTRDSPVWWKAPKGLVTDVLCDACGTNWRKYADINVRPVREETAVVAGSVVSVVGKPPKNGGDKREGAMLNGPTSKRLRKTSTATSISSPPPSTTPQMRCMACRHNGPVGKVIKCQRCQFRAHAGCCGAVLDDNNVESWTCDMCQNEETLEASFSGACVLCPRGKTMKKQDLQSADSYLRAAKPTEGQGWAHVLCSVFAPEVTFTDVSRLRFVEGISTMPQHRWQSRCSLCYEVSGATIRCADCAAEYHASCAWTYGHKFGFEVQQVRRRDGTFVNFRGVSGIMAPVVYCRDHHSDTSARRQHPHPHPHPPNPIFELCDVDEAGSGETALQVYCRTYKQAPVAQAHGLLRKARRMDAVLLASYSDHGSGSGSGHAAMVAGGDRPVTAIDVDDDDDDEAPSRSASSSPAQPQTPTDPVCSKCSTEYSPFFHYYGKEENGDDVHMSNGDGNSNGNANGNGFSAMPVAAVSPSWTCHRCFTNERKTAISTIF
ncbi:hypothetical protein CONPUDRAFT_112361 [Coniophora puteana RWD-64-598 SS2]|uniref:Uncharacterized protein n=1 Tax=Coniophora puteana (strain RWD-64-598) TaxID=741705 RepID=A0A5M3M8H5_CONPW|nr:uncharacterized protein CONPUDRAFT_112361 [Coniophora puteana RWD-64-598 SS2]EIW75100.1 hypothetical protein CONPUDRAFT_112361 [Coniophora puteana RWD-64-598 SS2]